LIGLTVRVVGTERVNAMLDKAQGRELAARAKRGVKAGAQALVIPIRREMVNQGIVNTGKMMRSVSSRMLRGGIQADVGPRVWYRHFPIRGTRRGISPHPVVDVAVARYQRDIRVRTADIILRGRR
jgi:hypothetical protein